MRSFDSATAAQFAARAGLVARLLVWIVARDRATGEPVSLGFWSGNDAVQFAINGAARDYYGAGALMQVDDFTFSAGLDVRMQRLVLSPLAPEVAQVIRGYEPRLARIEVHRALFDPATMSLVAEPHRLFRGWIDEVDIATPAIGGQAAVTITMASTARAMTRTLSLKKSDESQKLRGGDRFRRYADISGSVDVWWGEKRGKAKEAFDGGSSAVYDLVTRGGGDA